MKYMIKKQIFISVLLIFTAGLGHCIELKSIKKFYGACAPKSVEISPDGKYAAVMNLEGMSFWIIDASSFTFVKKVKFFAEPAKGWNYNEKEEIDSYAQKPVESCFSNDSRLLWVSLHNGDGVVVYDLKEELKPSEGQDFEKVKVKDYKTEETNTIKILKIKTGKTPKVIKINPDGKYALVSNWHGHSVSIIDTENYKKIKNIPMQGNIKYIPRGIAISTDSTKAYIANMRGGTISVINLESLEVVQDTWVTLNPRHLVITKDNKYLYISENIGGKVIKYDIRENKKIAETKVGERTRTIDITPDEKYIVAGSYDSDKITVLSADDLTIEKEIEFPSPIGLSISPDGRYLWAASYKKGIVQVFSIQY
ncbi:MAG: YncE family protein [Elusimicrobiota bacterium]